LIVICAGLIVFIGSSRRPLLKSSESRVACVAQEMLDSGNCGAPHLNGEVRTVTIEAARTGNSERMSLWAGRAPVGDGTFAQADAFITVHRPAQPNGAAIIICPGGGYSRLVTEPEGHGIACWLTQHGITGVVLEYRMPNGNARVPLLDAQRAMRWVRSKAAEWGCDPKRIGIMGFSAGGHVASTAATRFDEGDAQAEDPVDRAGSRPDFSLLIYPVISMGAMTHGGSKTNLLGPAPTAETVEKFSNELQVTEQTPPSFLAHAQDDSVVHPDNSRMFCEALQARNVPAEYLKLPTGGHGLNGYKGPMWDAWQAQSLKWLAEQKLIPVNDPNWHNKRDTA
jgi:acetyl esterase/lipase